MKPEYRLHGQVIARLGLLEANVGQVLLDKICAGRPQDVLRLLNQHTDFRDAVSNAAPEFLTRLRLALEADAPKKKDLLTLARYALRATHRSTPFGLFASVGVGSLCGHRSLFQDRPITVRPVWREVWDSAQDVSIQADTLVRVNPSASLWEGSIRYLEQPTCMPRGDFRISSIEVSPEVESLFSLLADGDEVPAHALVDLFRARAPAYSIEDVELFVRDLCDAGVLLATSPALSGSIRVGALGTPSMARRASEVEENASPNIQVNLIACLEGLSTYQGPPDNCAAVFPFLALFGDGPSPWLMAFKQGFKEKYENSRVPFLEAVDPDLGVDVAGAATWLQSDGGPSSSTTELLPLHIELLRLVDDSEGRPIDLQDSAFIKRLAAGALSNLPPTVAVIFEPPSLDGGPVFVKGAAPTPAARWISRFALDSPSISALHHELCGLENRALSNFCVAEVLYGLPGREAGLVDRPTSRPFVLRMFGSRGGEAMELCLRDLDLCLHRGRLVLWSNAHARPVLPLLTSAHNHRQGTDPVSRVLCELQHQMFPALGFGWGPIRRLKRHLPRVKVGRYVISPAQWILVRADIDYVCEARDVREFRQRLLSRVFGGEARDAIALVTGDQWLHFDLAQDSAIDVLWSSLRRLASATLAEPCGGRRAGQNGGHHTELMTFYVLDTNATHAFVDQAAVPRRPGHAREVQRTASLLDGMQFVEVYGPIRAIDDLVCRGLHRIIDNLPPSLRPSSWFFVRYGTPRFHLRLRFFSAPPPMSTRLLEALVVALQLNGPPRAPFEWKLAGYERETGRYGGETLLEHAEEMFCTHSVFASTCLEDPAWAIDETRRSLLAVATCVAVLREFLPGSALLEMLAQQVRAIELTAAPDSGWRKTIGETYRRQRSALRQAVSGAWNLSPSQLVAFKAFQAAAKACAMAARREDMQLGELVVPHTHMCCNRIFSSPTMLLELQTLELCRRVLMEEQCTFA